MLFPPNDTVCDPSGTCSASSFCAHHGSFPLNGSTHVLCAAMVDNGPGTPNFGGCGPPSSSDLANQTDVTSHELAETINDPLVAEARTNGPPLAWYDNQGEIADRCDGGRRLLRHAHRHRQPRLHRIGHAAGEGWHAAAHRRLHDTSSIKLLVSGAATGNGGASSVPRRSW